MSTYNNGENYNYKISPNPSLLKRGTKLVSAVGELKKDEQIAEKVYRVIIDCFINKELMEFNANDQRMQR